MEEYPSKIAMTSKIKSLTSQEMIYYTIRCLLLTNTVWITSRSKIVNSPSFFAESAVFHSTIDNCTKNPKEWNIAPKVVVNGDMSLLKLAGSCRRYPFPWILQTPQIKIPDL